jgi:hypothetical protein
MQIREPGPPGRGSLRWDSKYGYGFWATRTIEWLHCKLQTRPIVREGAPQKQDRKFQTPTFRQEVISGQVLQGCSIPRHTDRLTVSRKVTSNFDLESSLLMLKLVVLVTTAFWTLNNVVSAVNCMDRRSCNNVQLNLCRNLKQSCSWGAAANFLVYILLDEFNCLAHLHSVEDNVSWIITLWVWAWETLVWILTRICNPSSAKRSLNAKYAITDSMSLGPLEWYVYIVTQLLC